MIGVALALQLAVGAPVREFTDDWPSDSVPRGTVRVRVRTDSGYRLALLRRGRVVALSPHTYLTSYSASLSDQPPPPGIRVLATRFENGMTAVRARTLRELLPPQYRGVGGLMVYNDRARQRHAYLLADDGTRLQAFTRLGRPITLPTFHRVLQPPHYWSRRWVRGDRFRYVIALIDTIAGRCHLRRETLAPLIPEPIALPRGAWDQCAVVHQPFGADTLRITRQVAFTDTLGRTAVYRIRRRTVRPSGVSYRGRLVYVLRGGSLLLEDSTASPSARFHVMRPDGTSVPEAEYEEIRYQGCDFMQVRRAGVWGMLSTDGRFSPGIKVPFSC
jgi:hypothetical protein